LLPGSAYITFVYFSYMYVHAIYVPVAALLAAQNALAGGSLPTPDVACRKIVQIFILQGIE